MALADWLRRLLAGARVPARAQTRDVNGRGAGEKLDSERIEAARQRLKKAIPPPPDPEA